MAESIYEALILERYGHVAVITLNRPEKLNALDPTLVTDLHRVANDLVAWNDIRVVIVTGAGRGFCSGLDVNYLLEAPESGEDIDESKSASVEELGPLLRLIPHPIIAAVNGVAAGAGLAIALASDIRIASENARFSCIFVKRSLVPDTGSSYTLSRLVGQGIAMEMALTGNIYDAKWALEKGLVNMVVPPERLMEKALEMANVIASNPPLATRSIKQLLYEYDPNLYDVILKESAANAPSANSEDSLEAVRSFLEKRQPVYKAR